MSAARSRTGATGDDRREPALDLGDLARTDALVEAIAGRTPPAGDDLAAALVDWLDGIDQEFQALVAPAPLTVRPLEDAPSRRRRKAALLTAAAVFAVAAGTGVAAASPGSLLYPVHRSLFGAVDAQPDPLSQAERLLDQAQAVVSEAKALHQISVDETAAARALLHQALALIAAAPVSTRRTELLERQQILAEEVNRLSQHPAPAPSRTASDLPAPLPTRHSTATTDGGSSDRNSGDTSEGDQGRPTATESASPSAETSTSDGSDGSGTDGSSTDGSSPTSDSSPSSSPTSDSNQTLMPTADVHVDGQ